MPEQKHKPLYDLDNIRRIIKEKILPDPKIEDWRKKNYESMVKTIDDVTTRNIYAVHPPRGLAIYLKKDSEKYLALSKLYHHTKIDFTKERQEDIYFDEKISRMFLGLACEMILKSAFLLSGYCIHRINGKSFPCKFDELSQNEEFLDKTVEFWQLVKKINLILKFSSNETVELISNYLSIARDWRNNAMHLGVRHWENATFRHSILTCYEILSILVDYHLTLDKKSSPEKKASSLLTD